MSKLIVENLSGDVFTFEYSKDEHARVLFDSHIYRSGNSVEYWPESGQWFYVWNRKLDKVFECWKS